MTSFEELVEIPMGVSSWKVPTYCAVCDIHTQKRSARIKDVICRRSLSVALARSSDFSRDTAVIRFHEVRNRFNTYEKGCRGWYDNTLRGKVDFGMR